MSFAILGTFVLACILIELTPGPNMAFLALITLSDGKRFGFATVAGVTLGLLTIGVISAIGVATLVTKYSVIYQSLRIAGIFYLLWLAWQGWQHSSETSPEKIASKKALQSYFIHGFWINILNPKAALFFITMLPTFITTPQNATNQAIILTLISVSVATIVHILIVILASMLKPLMGRPASAQKIRRLLSIALACVAIWFAWSTQA